MGKARVPRTAIVEDHPLFRETIASVVDAMDDLDLGPVLPTANDALSEFKCHRPDLVLIDLSLPDMSGIELTERINGRWHSTRCVILSGHRRSEYAQQALGAGALAYILKGRPHDFHIGIGCVLDGRRYVSEAVGLPAEYEPL
jgi:DNA-binding NarL/FixJ family response regulator